MSTHYTATLEVHEVTHTPAGKNYNEVVPAKRETSEVTRLVLRADTIEKLQAKLSAHVALIEN